MARYLHLFICIIASMQIVRAQSDGSTNGSSSAVNISSKTIIGLQEKYSDLTSKLSKQSAKLLDEMQRKETRLYKKLNTIDNIQAQQLFSKGISQKYQDLQSGLAKTTGKFEQFPLKEYLPGVDSVQTVLNFALQGPNLPINKLEQLQTLSTKLKDLQGELQKANDIQAFVKGREAMLKEQLVNTGLVKQLKGINKQVYYYQAQLSAYKEILNDKEKLKEKLLETVRTLPAFQKFWQKNSYLFALFPMPLDAGTQHALIGLQTRTSVQNLLAQKSGVGENQGANPQQYFQEQIDVAQAQLNKLKNKINKITNGSGNSNMTMPDFKPNDQKTKSFFKRLEYGFNIQSEPARYSLPKMSDIAISLGYKFSDNKTFGIGGSYKIGWGRDIGHMHITNEGIGLRSYVDIKAKGSIWLTGGFEYNYLNSFKTLEELHNNVDAWQRSALMGLSRKYKVGKREGNMQLLYDLLHSHQNPPGTALKFRIGYTF